jgi:monoamine oxidase
MLHLAWTQVVCPQYEKPDSYLFDGAAAQFPALQASKLPPNTVRINNPVWSIEQTMGPNGKPIVVATTLKGTYHGKAIIVEMSPHLAGRINYKPALPPIRDQLTQRTPMGTIFKVGTMQD